MKQFKIKENYLLLKKWWETIDLTNYEKSFLNKEIIYFNQQLLRLKEKKIRIGTYGKSGVGKSSVLKILSEILSPGPNLYFGTLRLFCSFITDESLLFL